MTPDVCTRVARLLPKLASDHDGEVIATVNALRRVLQASGHDLHDLARIIAPMPPTLRPAPSGARQGAEAPRAPLGMPAKLIWLCSSPTVREQLHSSVYRTLKAALARYERMGVGCITPGERDLIEKAYAVFAPENPS